LDIWIFGSLAFLKLEIGHCLSYNELMEKIKIIFIGTDDIGAPLLEALNKDKRFKVALVITQVDKPAGRKMQLTAPPIKSKANELGLDVYQPYNINDADSLKKIKNAKADMIVLMAYGQILKKEILEMPVHGCINIHASILPKYRGASPIQQSLLRGDNETGISIMRMEEKMDTGPVFAMETIKLKDDDNAETLHKKLADLTASATPDILYEIANDELAPKPQDDEKATYCQKIHKTDGNLNWNETAKNLEAKVRAFAGWPGTFTFFNGSRIKILSAEAREYNEEGPDGTVVRQGNDIMVTARRGALLLKQIQMEGKNPQPVNEFIKGHPDFVGSVLG
jgi:methionyl-tRNA formyltransferase